MATQQEGQKSAALVDYLSVTFPFTHGLELVKLMFGGDDWVLLDRGMRGYTEVWARGSAWVMMSPANPRMGIHVSLSGQGCRELEAYGVVSDEDRADLEDGVWGWEKFIGNLIDFGGKFTRLDLALDDREGILSMQVLREHLVEGNVATRWKTWNEVKPDTYVRTGEEKGSSTLYLGKRVSEAMLRFYDKRAEQEAKGKKVEGDEPWIRCEIELKGKRSDAMAKLIADQGFHVVAGVLKGYVDFKSPARGKQVGEWPTAPFWKTFLGNVRKLKLATAPKVRSVERVKAWVVGQVAPALSLLLDVEAGDLTWLMKTMKEGKARYREWHKTLLRNERLAMVRVT